MSDSADDGTPPTRASHTPADTPWWRVPLHQPVARRAQCPRMFAVSDKARFLRMVLISMSLTSTDDGLCRRRCRDGVR